MSRAAFQTSPLISFSHFPRGTRSYITASLALRSRQQATNHTEVNKHIACLRQDEYSTITPNTVVLMMNECHGNGTFGFDFLNWAFFQTCHSTVIPWSYVGFWSRKRSVWKLQVSEQFILFYLFFWRRRELLPLPSPVALECALAHPANAQRYTHRTQFFLFTYLFLLERPVGPLTRFLLILHHWILQDGSSHLLLLWTYI